MRKIIGRIRLVTKAFVRNHIIDHEENIWPNMSAMELHEAERRTLQADVAQRRNSAPANLSLNP